MLVIIEYGLAEARRFAEANVTRNGLLEELILVVFLDLFKYRFGEIEAFVVHRYEDSGDIEVFVVQLLNLSEGNSEL